ncbi:MAG: hypothetical protein ACLFO1_02800 [Spirochaetaceae bacterium]
MSQTQAYWVSATGTWVDAGEDHLASVLENPEQFGLSKTRIEEVYAQHSETVGTEGRARDQLIQEAARSGWVRVRRYSEPANRIVLQSYNLESKVSSLRSFLQELAHRKIVSPEDTVVLSDYETGEARTFRLRSGDAEEADGETEGFLEASDES